MAIKRSLIELVHTVKKPSKVTKEDKIDAKIAKEKLSAIEDDPSIIISGNELADSLAKLLQ